MKRHILTVLLFFFFASGFCQEFTGQFKLVFSRISQDGLEHRDTIDYYFDDNRTAMLVRGKRGEPDMRMVFDSQSKIITALVDQNGTKSGYQLPMDPIHWPGMIQSTRKYDAENIGVNYTGKSKTIEGHTCQEALAESADYEVVVWLAEDVPLNMLRVMSYQSVGKQKSTREIEIFEQFRFSGLPLAMELVSKTGMNDVDMKIIEINNNINTEIFSTEASQVFDATE